jgi:hypothetical protein
MTKRRSRIPLPSQDRLKRLIDYNPETGEASWRRREPSDFPPDGKYSPERLAATFNGRYAGRPAMTATQDAATWPRKHTHLDGEHYLAARVVWKLVYGEEPEEIIAENGDLCDLRIKNLRATDTIYRTKNKTMFRDNTSGVRGVCWDSNRNQWRAEIKANGRKISLGRFARKDDAIRARERAEEQHGFRDIGRGRHAWDDLFDEVKHVRRT